MPMDKSGAGRELEAQRLDFVEHLDRDLEAETQVAVIHQRADTLFLEQAVDVGHALGQMVVQNRAADGRVDEGALDLNRLGVNDVLIVVGGGQVDQFARSSAGGSGVRVSTSPASSAISTSSMLAKARPSPLAPGFALVR